MSILYSKLRLEVPQTLDGEDATITGSKGAVRTVEMSSPITDIMLAGMEKYRVQAGLTDENVSFGYGQIKKVEATFRSILKKLPYNFFRSSAVVLNNEIHILGSENSGDEKKHYKWDGTSWVSVSTLPYEFKYGKAVVLNNEIHILGSIAEGNEKKHYKWDGTSWTSVSTLPYEFIEGSAVVLNNEIHILGSAYNTGSYPNLTWPHTKKHYKWNGSSWTSVSTLPYEFWAGGAVVYNNEIHILGSGYWTVTSSTTNYPNEKKHYKRNGSSWVSVSTLPYEFDHGSAIVYNNEIHILSSTYRTSSDGYLNSKKHYNWNGSSWVSVSTLPYTLYFDTAVIWNDGVDDNIAYFSAGKLDAQWDGTSWTVGTD